MEPLADDVEDEQKKKQKPMVEKPSLIQASTQTKAPPVGSSEAGEYGKRAAADQAAADAKAAEEKQAALKKKAAETKIADDMPKANDPKYGGDSSAWAKDVAEWRRRKAAAADAQKDALLKPSK